MGFFFLLFTFLRIASEVGGRGIGFARPTGCLGGSRPRSSFVCGRSRGKRLEEVTEMAAAALPLRGALRAGFIPLRGKLSPASVRSTLRRNYGVVTSPTGEKVTHTGQVSKKLDLPPPHPLISSSCSALSGIGFLAVRGSRSVCSRKILDPGKFCLDVGGCCVGFQV